MFSSDFPSEYRYRENYMRFIDYYVVNDLSAMVTTQQSN